MVRFERCRAGVSRHAAIGGLTKASGVALAILLAKIKLARGCRWNRRDIFVERQFGFLPNAGILGVARFAFLLIGLRFLRSRPLRLRHKRPVIAAWLRRPAAGWGGKDPDTPNTDKG